MAQPNIIKYESLSLNHELGICVQKDSDGILFAHTEWVVSDQFIAHDDQTQHAFLK